MEVIVPGRRWAQNGSLRRRAVKVHVFQQLANTIARSSLLKKKADIEGKTQPLLPQDMKEADNESKMEPILPTDVRGEMVEANIESKREPLLSSAVEKEDMSWRTNLQEFPALPERRDGEHSSFTLHHPLRTPNMKGMVKADIESKTEPLLPQDMKEADIESKTEPLLPQDMKEADNESKMEPILPTDMRGEMVEANIESKTEPLLSSAVEKEDMSWRRNLQEFPALPERRDGEHNSFTLHHPLRTPNVKGMVEADIESKTEPLLPQDMKEADSESKMEPSLPTDVRDEMVEANTESKTEPLLSSAVEKEDMPWRINLEEFPELPERRDAEHGSFILLFLRTLRKQRKVNDYYKKQKRLLEGFTEMETMIEIDCAPGNLTEDEMKQREKMAILVINIANIVLFALKVFASIDSKSFSIIASILDPFFELLWGFILWLTSRAMENPNQHKYPIGMKRLQPVGIIVFGSFGLQLLFQAAKQFITKSEPEKDPQKEKWMIGVMTFVTMVQFMLAFYCRRFENKIVRAYAEHHSSNLKTNLISLAAAVLAIRYYWWIDPTGAIIILLYTMNTWKKTFFENLFALIGRTAPPEFLAKLTYLIWNHHKDIKHIDTVKAYAHGSDHYFVEVDIVLPQDMVLREAHDIGETLQVKLEQLPEVERAFVHTDYECTHKPEHKTTV